jgi:pilus assembly protein CpaB
MDLASVTPALVILIACLQAVATDLRELKIRNSLTLPLFISGLLYHGIAGGGVALAESASGGLAGFLIFFPAFLLGILGGGDVKLLAAVGAWLGREAVCGVALIGCLALAITSTWVLLRQRRIGDGWQGVRLVCRRIGGLGRHLSEEDFESVQTVARRADCRQQLLPFSVMITIGVAAFCVWSVCVSNWSSSSQGQRKIEDGPMNTRSLVVVGLALTCGASAAVGVGMLREKPLLAPKLATVTVMMAATELPRGTAITPEMLTAAEWPKEKVPAGVITSANEAVGRTVVIPLLQGEPVLGPKLADSDAGRGVAPLVTPGMRAFTVMTPTLASGVAGLVLPGNKVDLLWTATSNPGQQKDPTGGGTTVTLLQNVEILAVDQEIEAPSGQVRKELRSVTLLVTEPQAKKLSLAQSKGTLNLALRNDSDQTRAETPSVTLNDIRDVRDLPREEAAPPQEPRPAPPPPPVRVRIRTLRGRHSGQVLFELHGRAAVPEAERALEKTRERPDDRELPELEADG